MKKILLLAALLSTNAMAWDRTHTDKGEKLEYVNGRWVWVAPHLDSRGEIVYGAESKKDLNPNLNRMPVPNGYRYEQRYDADCKCYKTYLVSLTK